MTDFGAAVDMIRRRAQGEDIGEGQAHQADGAGLQHVAARDLGMAHRHRVPPRFAVKRLHEEIVLDSLRICHHNEGLLKKRPCCLCWR